MKWLIVEDALRDCKGHWLEYVSTFVRDLRALGDEVVVLCDQKAEGFVMEQTGARPLLPESIWHRMSDGAGAVKRYLRVPGHAWATFVGMQKFFKNFSQANTDSEKLIAKNIPPTRHPIPSTSSPPDWIFVPTVLVHHLLGWCLLLKAGFVPGYSRVLFFFPNLPIQLDDEGQPHWTGGPTTKLLAWLFENLRVEVESGKVVLGVETNAMRRALEGLIQIPVVYLPHPVEAAQPPRTDSGRLRTEVEDQNIDSSNNPLCAICHPPSGYAKPIVFGCYGAARWEKGSDIFLKAIRLVLQKAEKLKSLDPRPSALDSSLAATAAGRPLRFAIQWVGDFQDEKGNLVQLDPWLKNHPQVEVMDRYFKGEEYERQLERTHVMVLPYRSPYRLRVSRVVIEAMLSGMPVIASKGTTLFEQAEEYSVVVGCEDGDAASLAGAILEVAERFESLRANAEEKASAAADFFSVAWFKKALI